MYFIPTCGETNSPTPKQIIYLNFFKHPSKVTSIVSCHLYILGLFSSWMHKMYTLGFRDAMERIDFLSENYPGSLKQLVSLGQ
jgi:hypothetical protein